MSTIRSIPTKRSLFADYWRLYGYSKALFKSAYFYVAMAVTGLCYETWIQQNWWDLSFQIIPSMMGFSIAAFAMIVAVGHEKFLRVLATRPAGWDSSALEGTAAAFFHFLFVQFLALIAAALGKSLWSVLSIPFARGSIGAIGFFLLIYACTCALAASLRIFSLALRFGDLLKIEREKAEHEEAARAEQSKPPSDSNKIASVP